MKAVWSVARAMFRGWRHEVVRSLGGNLWAYRSVVALVALSAVGWTLLAASARSMLGLSSLQAGGLRALLLATTLNLALAMAGVVTVGLTVLVPETSSFATLLATMPLTPVQRRVALDGPVLAFGMTTAGLVAAPFVWLSVLAEHGVGPRVAVIAAAIAVTLTGALLGAALQRAVGVVVGLVLRLSRGVSRPVAAIVVYVLIAQQCLVAGVGTGESVSRTRAALKALADLCTSSPAAVVGLAAALPVAAGALWWLTTWIDGRRPSHCRAHLVGPDAGMLLDRPRSLFQLELLQLVRHPVNQSSLIVLGAVTLAAPLVHQVRDVLLWPVGGVLLLSMASLLVVGSYGATWSHHWLFRTASAQPVGWVRGKWLAALTFWLALLAVLSAAFAVTPLWDERILVAVSPQLFLAFVMSMLVGLAVPASEEQPLSSVVGVVLAAVAGIGFYLLTDRLSGGSELVLLTLVAALAGAAMLAYVRLARWRERDLVF
ncbi:hypothetical protein acdb102_17120 [Acidothermaceae bacterium B102]|nr:hypothetical protein acdb102_17120 [Acidothermaceae bacterium B102]